MKNSSKPKPTSDGNAGKKHAKGGVASKDSMIADEEHTLVKVSDEKPPKPVVSMSRSGRQPWEKQLKGNGDGVVKEGKNQSKTTESRKEVGWGGDTHTRTHKRNSKN